MNRLELFNEHMILMSCYYMFIYSDGLLMIPNPDTSVQEKIADKETMWVVAWSQIAWMGTLVLVNLVFMLYKQFGTMTRKCKLNKLKKKHQKMMAERAKQY